MIKDRVLQLIDNKGFTKEDFFRKISMTSANFRGNAKNTPLNSTAIENILSVVPDLNLSWLITGKGDMFTNDKPDSNIMEPSDVYIRRTDTLINQQLIPLYDLHASASVVEILRDPSKLIPLDHIKIPNLPKCDGAIHITGDSMYPLLKSGDIVLYREVKDRANIVWGEMYLCYLNNNGDEFFFCKYLHPGDKEGYIKFVSQNQHHQPVEFPEKSIQQLAIIKASIRINSVV